MSDSVTSANTESTPATPSRQRSSRRQNSRQNDKRQALKRTGVRVLIALGSNLGNPIQQLDKAVLELSIHPQIACIAVSKYYKSRPQGPQNQPNFINAVLEVRTTLSPLALLAVLHDIEDAAGRTRDVIWGPRTLDLDMILYGDVTMETPRLILPHACAHLREFVVKPLHDLDADLVIPTRGRVADLLKQLPIDTLEEIRNAKYFDETPSQAPDKAPSKAFDH